MSHDLSPYQAPSLSRSESRDFKRSLARLDGRGRLELSRIDQVAELDAARVRGIGRVGRTAMHELTLVSQLEQGLSRLAPAACDRLQAIADLTGIAMAEVVHETARRMRS
jgi:hypothetical protein